MSRHSSLSHRFLLAPLLVASFAVLAAGPAEAALPDLVVKDVTMNPACQVEITIANVGAGRLPPGTQLGVNVQFSQNGVGAGGWLLPWTLPMELGPGGKVTTTVSQKTIVGTMNVKVHADFRRNILETNDTNNSASRVFTCPNSQPDLIPEIVSVTPGPRLRSPVAVRVRVRNLGPAAALSSSSLRVLLYRTKRGRLLQSSVVEKLVPISTMMAGESKFADVQLLLKEPLRGRHEIKVEADYGNRLQETKEGNNTATTAFDVR